MVELGSAEPVAFATLLREYRLSAGLTQEVLAERAGVGYRTIQDLEEGLHQPRRETLAKLVRGLGLVGARRARFEAATHPTPRGLGSGTQPIRLAARPERVPAPNLITQHNLPAQLTSFVGRAQAVAGLTEQLRQSRLLTLTGTGGCGKTRLALRVVEGLVDAYPDGVWLVDLAPISDPTFVPPAIAAVLGLREETAIPIQRTLLNYLRTRQLLLLVDNCEHVIAASAQLIETILRSCPRITALATSREALNLAGEVAWRVPSLTLPAENDPSIALDLPGRFLASEAVRLFVERAKAADARFEVTPSNAPTIAQICRRLDGLPLALELAAARLRVLSVEQVAARLDDRFHLLMGGSRTALSRQQTLRATMDWSYALLSEPERKLLRQLAVFAGGWTLEAAEAVASAEEGTGGTDTQNATPVPRFVLDLLTQLVDKSLVLVDKDPAEPRYRMLETIRQYGRDRLVEVDKTYEAHERHFTWFLALAEKAGPELLGARQVAWLRRLGADDDNLRAALEWGLAAVPEDGARMAGHLWQFWYFRTKLSEGMRWLDRALAVTPRGTGLHAKLLAASGVLLREMGDVERARACSEEALSLSEGAGEKVAAGWALNNLGLIARDYQGEPGRGRALFEESVRLFQVAGVWAGVGMGLRDLSTTARGEGDDARAQALGEESLEILREVGDCWNLGWTLGHLSWWARLKQDSVRARGMAAESLSLCREIGNAIGMLQAQITLADVARLEGDLDQARTLLVDLLADSRDWETGPAYRIDQCLAAVGKLAIQQGDARRGVVLIGTRKALQGGPSIRVLRAEDEASLAVARSVIGDDAFAEAWAVGQSMTRAQAIDYALEGSDG